MITPQPVDHSAGGAGWPAFKVLLVSPALGTPGPMGPQRDESVALLEGLADLGSEITLVVERSFADDRSSASASNPTQLAAIHRYLETGRYDPTLFYRGTIARLLALHAPRLLHRIAQRRQTRADMAESPIENEGRDAAGSPGDRDYLRRVRRFLFLRRFYSSACLRAVYGSGPAEIDARDHDLVVIDGLFPIRVVNADRGIVVTFVRKMLDLTSPSTPAKLRRIAAQALMTTTQAGGRFAFAADSAREAFERLVDSKTTAEGRFVLGPMASSAMVGAAAAPVRPSGGHLPIGVQDDRTATSSLAELTESGIIRRLFPDLFGLLASDGRTYASASGGWDTSLPTIVFSWNVPGRINVPLLEKAARALAGKANILLLDADGRDVAQPNVRSASPRSIQERQALLSRAAAIVLPEPTGAGPRLIEAQALGARAICPDVPENREYGPASEFYPGSSPDGLVEVLLKVASAGPATASGVVSDAEQFRRRYHDEPRARLQNMLDTLKGPDPLTGLLRCDFVIHGLTGGADESGSFLADGRAVREDRTASSDHDAWEASGR